MFDAPVSTADLPCFAGSRFRHWNDDPVGADRARDCGSGDIQRVGDGHAPLTELHASIFRRAVELGHPVGPDGAVWPTYDRGYGATTGRLASPGSEDALAELQEPWIAGFLNDLAVALEAHGYVR